MADRSVAVGVRPDALFGSHLAGVRVALFHGVRPTAGRSEPWLKKRLFCSKQRCPSPLTGRWCGVRRRAMDRVIGMDPRKRSVTIEARDSRRGTVRDRDVRQRHRRVPDDTLQALGTASSRLGRRHRIAEQYRPRTPVGVGEFLVNKAPARV
jgi:hypothetical protein